MPQRWPISIRSAMPRGRTSSASPSLSTATPDVQMLALRRCAREPSPGSELAPWERVLEQVLAWVQPDWVSSPEYRWVPSRVDEHKSRATSLVEQLGLP